MTPQMVPVRFCHKPREVPPAFTPLQASRNAGNGSDLRPAAHCYLRRHMKPHRTRDSLGLKTPMMSYTTYEGQAFGKNWLPVKSSSREPSFCIN